MKRLDKLIIKAFIGPFILTFFVVVFILLVIQIAKYFDELVGKNLGWDVLSELFFYFGIFNTPIALPLAVLLSSLMTFGNLGEHSELTAIKSAGISLTRALMPIFVFVSCLTVVAFFSNNYLVPQAALNAYSLIYDIKQQKPALDLKEGTFYNGIPDFSIKAKEKLDDDKTLKGLIIYDHNGRLGNKEVIVADSGIMYTILDDRFLKFELFNGAHFEEAGVGKRKIYRNDEIVPFTRVSFSKSEMVFDLSSFDLKRTRKELFSNDRLTRNFHQLKADIDSITDDLYKAQYEVYRNSKSFFAYHLKGEHNPEPPARLLAYRSEFDSLDLAEMQQRMEDSVEAKNQMNRAKVRARRISTLEASVNLDSMFSKGDSTRLYNQFAEAAAKRKGMEIALNVARQVKTRLNTQNTRIQYQNKQFTIFNIQYRKMVAHAFACMVMFLIGAPLGAIIKKGGLGFPVLLSIIFFIIFYVLYITGENWAKNGEIEIFYGVWMSNFLLTPVGLFFLRQARHDARLFDSDFYQVALAKIRTRFSKNGQ